MDEQRDAATDAATIDRLLDLPKPQRFLELAKAFAASQGHVHGDGGRIVAGDGKAVAHGWSSYARKFKTPVLDWAVRGTTSFPGFAPMVEAEKGYYPTMRIDQDWRALPVADAYDLAQEARQDPRRAYRKMPEPPVAEAAPEPDEAFPIPRP